jgi:hypothetical protein
LLYYKGDFCPSCIFFAGYGGHVFCLQDEHNFINSVLGVQMKQLGGVLGLASLCKQGTSERYAERILLVLLLEGDTKYVDVLMQTLYWSELALLARMKELDNDTGEIFHGPGSHLINTTHPYVKTMVEGKYPCCCY